MATSNRIADDLQIWIFDSQIELPIFIIIYIQIYLNICTNIYSMYVFVNILYADKIDKIKLIISSKGKKS